MVYESRLARLAARFNLMVALVFSLLISNVILSFLLWWSFNKQRIEITPFNLASGYFKSESQVDGNYLDLMSENFIYARFNTTPATVGEAHKRLLTFIAPENYAHILKVLTQESFLIKEKKIASHFVIKNIKTDVANLTTKVAGTLKRSVALRALADEEVLYSLHYRYTNGRLTILSFSKEKIRG